MIIDRRAVAHKLAGLARPRARDAVSSWLLLRALGAVYLIAFVSLWIQLDGLIGRDGILPAGRYLEVVRRFAGPERYRLLPTLCWFDTSDRFLHGLALAGSLAAVSLACDVVPALGAAVAWASYLSLTLAARDFLAFQWDALLLEAGFLAIFLAPLDLGSIRPRAAPPPPLVLGLVRWLVFRLMFSSGVVKLSSGDAAWRGLTALRYHYETQPLPTWVGWYAHQLPAWFQDASVVALFVIELLIPFFIWAPRRLQQVAFAAFAGWHALVAATGNYGFFSLLSVALCLTLLDDDAWPRRLRECLQAGRTARGWPTVVLVPVACVLFVLGALELSLTLGLQWRWPAPVVALYRAARPFRTVNGYGLFAVMTTTRPEIVVEGSDDGVTWLPYEFKWKPGDVRRRPGFVEPHQPRLDWQMWFAALGSYDDTPWFAAFLERLLRGSPPVLALLERNPFPAAPPRYVRAMLYDYRFADPGVRRREGAWWRREAKGPYSPVLSLK